MLKKMISKWINNRRLSQQLTSFENKVKSDFPNGTLVMDCHYHPCVVHGSDVDLHLIDLLDHDFHRSVDSAIHFCHPYQCCVKISQEFCDQLIDAYMMNGEKGLALLNGWTEEDYEKFLNEWT